MNRDMKILETDTVRFFSKGTVLLHEGDICRFGCKVISGCLKSYTLDKSGKEHILQFAPEGWIITDMNGMLNKVPANISIEAIEDTEVFWIQSEMKSFWLNASKEELIEQINLLTRNIIAANKRTRMLLSSSAEERYLDFLDTYPTLAQRLPLKQIASYVGITPEYLSEIRRKIAHK